MWSSKSTFMTRSCLAACLLISLSSFKLSTASIIEIYGAIYFTLLVCRWPMKCHWISFGNCSTFCFSSCSWLSPNRRWPSAYAASIYSQGWYLLMATNSTPLGRLPITSCRFFATSTFICFYSVAVWLFCSWVSYSGTSSLCVSWFNFGLLCSNTSIIWVSWIATIT